MGSDDQVTGPINLGKPGEFTIIELAEKVIKLSNSKSEVVYKKLPSDDPKQRRPDITQARKILEWEPEIELEEGLKKTIAYFDEILTKG